MSYPPIPPTMPTWPCCSPAGETQPRPSANIAAPLSLRPDHLAWRGPGLGAGHGARAGLAKSERSTGIGNTSLPVEGRQRRQYPGRAGSSPGGEWHVRRGRCHGAWRMPGQPVLPVSSRLQTQLEQQLRCYEMHQPCRGGGPLRTVAYMPVLPLAVDEQTASQGVWEAGR